MVAPNPSVAKPPAAAAPGAPSQRARTVINLLLFVHLFSLAAIFLFNGSVAGPREQLRRVPGYYLQVLGMDVDFDSGQRFNWALQAASTKDQLRTLRENLVTHGREGRIHEAEKNLTLLIDLQKQNPRDPSRRGLYHLTHGDVLDVGHFVEFRYTRDGTTQHVGLPAFVRAEPVTTVEATLPRSIGWRWFWPRARFQRYQMLAREIARLAGRESEQDVLPTAIVEGLLRSEGIEPEELSSLQPRLICSRLTTQTTQQADEARQQMAHSLHRWESGWFQPAYQKTPVVVRGRILFNDEGGLQRDYSPAVEPLR